MELKGKKINFLGDSITEGYGTSDEDHRFTALIEKKTGAVCCNYGIGGTRIARQQNPADDTDVPENSDYCFRALNMDPDADIICVFGGTNDYGHGDAPIGSFDDRTPDTFCGALNTLCTELAERYPAARIVFFTPLHRAGENNPKDGGEGPTLKTYVDLIRQAAEQYSFPVLDLYRVSGLQPEIPAIRELYVPDGLHPNDAGHVRLTDIIVAFLESL